MRHPLSLSPIGCLGRFYCLKDNKQEYLILRQWGFFEAFLCVCVLFVYLFCFVFSASSVHLTNQPLTHECHVGLGNVTPFHLDYPFSVRWYTCGIIQMKASLVLLAYYSWCTIVYIERTVMFCSGLPCFVLFSYSSFR